MTGNSKMSDHKRSFAPAFVTVIEPVVATPIGGPLADDVFLFGLIILKNAVAVTAELAGWQDEDGDPKILTYTGLTTADVPIMFGAGAINRRTPIVTGIIGEGSTTTNIVTASMDPAAAVANEFAGRIAIFDLDTTTADLRGQARDITANTDVGVLTTTAFTDAPVAGDTFTMSRAYTVKASVTDKVLAIWRPA